jgi:hypothetical protein
MIKPLVFNRRGVLGLAAGALWSETAVAADQTEKLQRLFTKRLASPDMWFWKPEHISCRH